MTSSARTDPGRPTISVVIPTRDRPELLDECLLTIRQSMRPEDELIVVDSASTTEGVRDVANAHGASYTRCEEPGASRARNAGWRRATNDVIAFVDDDVRVARGWADAVAHTFGDAPVLAFLTGSVGIPKDETPEFPVATFQAPEPFAIDASTSGDLGHSANMAVRKSALATVGGFDELMGAGAKYRAAEDKDLLERLVLAGLRGRYEPSAAAFHVPWRQRRDVLTLNLAYGLGLGAWIAKLLKTDRGRARRAVRITFWEWGFLDLASWVRRRFKFLSLVVLVRIVGMMLGVVWALPAPVRNGHFSARTSASTHEPTNDALN